jgi:hypothetical protein
MSVRQLTSNRRSLEGGHIKLPLFLITLLKTATSTEMFKLTNLCHLIIKVQAYGARNSLTQCFNCQKFGHIAKNCRQPLDACGVVAVTYTRSAQKQITWRPPYHTAATAGYRMESDHIQLPWLQQRQRETATQENAELPTGYK